MKLTVSAGMKVIGTKDRNDNCERVIVKKRLSKSGGGRSLARLVKGDVVVCYPARMN